MGDIIAEQEMMTMRVDQDITDATENMQGAERQLHKYYKRISSNRMLILKVMGIVLFFVIFFIVFLT